MSAFPYALWKERANLRLHGSRDSTESSLIEDGKSNLRLADVEAWPLDALPMIVGLPVIDLMKVDIEGFECEFIKNTSAALALTDRLVIEWHKWVTGRDAVDDLLAAQGFSLRKVISEDPHCGVAIYDRKEKARAVA